MGACDEKIVPAKNEKPTPKNDCDMMCTLDYKPVCATDGMTYSNICEMKVAKCYNPAAHITMMYEGHCIILSDISQP